MKKFKETYDKLMEEGEATTPTVTSDGLMGSGGNIEDAIKNPRTAIYGLWKKNDPKSIKKVKEKDLKEFLKNNKDYEVMKRY